MLKFALFAMFYLAITAEATPITVTFSQSVFLNNLRKFEVKEELAVGGSSRVVKVYDAELKLFLVLKCQGKMDQNKSFLWNEFNALKKLGAFAALDAKVPPTLPKVYGYGEANGMEVLLEEFFPEGDLLVFAQRLLQQHEKIRKYYYAAIGVQVMEFLIFAEANGVKHADLKPENILIDVKVRPIRIAVCDFGNSWYQDGPLEEHTPGTLPYMSGRIHKVCDAAGTYATLPDFTLSDELESAMNTLALAMDLTLPWWLHHELHVKLSELQSQTVAINVDLPKLINELPPINWEWEKYNFNCSKKIGEMKETKTIKSTFEAIDDQDFKEIFILMLDHTRDINVLPEPLETLKEAFKAKMIKHAT